MAQELTDACLEEALKKEGLLVVDFWAEWCGPCKKVSPVVDEVAEEYADSVDIRKCDVEDNPETCDRFGIMNIPTILFIKNGEMVDRHVGTLKKEQLKELIEKNR